MGFRGMSPKQIARMMKKMGIKQEEVEGAKEVIIRFDDKEWIIENAQVMMIKQGNSESYQISGKKLERSLKDIETVPQLEEEIVIPIEDAALVASQTGVDIEIAKETLRETKGDLAAAILKLRHS